MIYILGGLGFVGSAFVRYCEKNDLEHKVIDLHNYEDFKSASCNLLINANGNSKKFLAREKPLEEFDASVRSVRASAVDIKANKYIYLSTCDVYPDCSSPETSREEQTIDIQTTSPYGFHKYLAEQIVQHTQKNWLIIRMGGFVGEGLKKNAIYDILHGGPIWLHPDSELQFMNTDAMADAIFSLNHQGHTNDIFNICGKGLIRLQEVIDHLETDIVPKENTTPVQYEVSTEKVSQFISIPETKTAVLNFIDTYKDTK